MKVCFDLETPTDRTFAHGIKSEERSYCSLGWSITNESYMSRFDTLKTERGCSYYNGTEKAEGDVVAAIKPEPNGTNLGCLSCGVQQSGVVNLGGCPFSTGAERT